MKSATTVVALVLTLLAWASVAKAQNIDIAQYSIPTRAPEGGAVCLLFVGVTKDAGARGHLLVELFTKEGEARIPELGIASGVQDGCDAFPNNPSTVFALDRSEDVFLFEWTLELHAHPDADCEAGGTAKGIVGVATTAFGGRVEVSLSSCVGGY